MYGACVRVRIENVERAWLLNQVNEKISIMKSISPEIILNLHHIGILDYFVVRKCALFCSRTNKVNEDEETGGRRGM